MLCVRVNGALVSVWSIRSKLNSPNRKMTLFLRTGARKVQLTKRWYHINVVLVISVVFNITKALFTHNILAHNIKIKRYWNKKKFILSKYCSYISKSIQINRNKHFQFTQETILDKKMSFFIFFITILCVKMSCVKKVFLFAVSKWGAFYLFISNFFCYTNYRWR